MKDRILIIDDDENIIRMLKQFFLDNFLEVFTAKNAVEAVMLLKEVKPQVIITDLEMPGVDGIRLTQTLKKAMAAQHKNIPMIVLTSHDTPDDEKRSYAAGADLFMGKPPKLNILLLRVQEFLNASEIK